MKVQSVKYLISCQSYKKLISITDDVRFVEGIYVKYKTEKQVAILHLNHTLEGKENNSKTTASDLSSEERRGTHTQSEIQWNKNSTSIANSSIHSPFLLIQLPSSIFCSLSAHT